MSHWDVSDVVQLLKSFQVSREALIFVFRHNIDGATMDESVELLVKDFQLDDAELESQIVEKWKDISSNGLLPNAVLDRDENGKVIRSPVKTVATPAVLHKAIEPITKVFTKIEAKIDEIIPVSSSAVIDSKEDNVAPARAQFTHLKSGAWSRSGKFSPKALQIEEEPASNAEESKSNSGLHPSNSIEVKQELSAVKAESPFHKPPMAWSPSFKRSVKVFRFDDDTIIEIPGVGDEETVPPVTVPAKASETENKVEVVVVKEVHPVEESQPDSAQTTEENTYEQEDWEAELDELHKHSITEEPTADLPRTSPTASRNVVEDDTVGFEKSIVEELSVHEYTKLTSSDARVDSPGYDTVDADLDAIIAKQTEEYIQKVASSRSPFHSPAKPLPHTTTTSNAHNTHNTTSTESEIIQKYQADLQKQAELLRLQQEQIALQRQLIEQQRKDLNGTDSPRKTPRSLKSHAHLKNHKRSDKTNHQSNTSSIPVRAGIDYSNADFDDAGEPFYSDNIDTYYSQAQTLPAPSTLYDSISMLSDSGVFDTIFHNNVPFPGVFMPESSITSANSGDYDHVANRKYRDTPSPREATEERNVSASHDDEDYQLHTREPHRPLFNNKVQSAVQRNHNNMYHSEMPMNNTPQFRSGVFESHHEQQYGEVLSDRQAHRAPAYDHTSLMQGSTDSAGHVWHHVQSTTKRTAQRPFVPTLDIGVLQEQSTPPQRQAHAQITLGPETTSPGETKVPEAALVDLMNVLKDLAVTNAALTQALLPASVPADTVNAKDNKVGAQIPATLRSAPGAARADGRGRRGTFLAGEGAAETKTDVDTNTTNDMSIPGRPAWDPHHTDQATLALTSARTEPRGRPKSRESATKHGVRILRAGSRGRSRGSTRPKPEAKPALQDYIDLLAKEFVKRPLCQAPYYTSTSNVVFNVQHNSKFDLHPIHTNSHSNKHSSQREYSLNQAFEENFLRSHSRPFEHFNRSTSPKSAKSSKLNSPKSPKSLRSPKSPTAKKGGFIFLDLGPSEVAYEGPHYAAPQDRSLKNLHANGMRSAASSPGRRPVSRGPGRVTARPASAIGLVGSAPFGPIVPLVPIAAAPPASARPSTGNSSRNKARALVQASTRQNMS